MLLVIVAADPPTGLVVTTESAVHLCCCCVEFRCYRVVQSSGVRFNLRSHILSVESALTRFSQSANPVYTLAYIQPIVTLVCAKKFKLRSVLVANWQSAFRPREELTIRRRRILSLTTSRGSRRDVAVS